MPCTITQLDYTNEACNYTPPTYHVSLIRMPAIWTIDSYDILGSIEDLVYTKWVLVGISASSGDFITMEAEYEDYKGNIMIITLHERYNFPQVLKVLAKESLPFCHITS